MNDKPDEERRGLGTWLKQRLHVLIAMIGLVAWVAMLWFMFGDVL